MIECGRCHTSLPEHSRFCFSCGADLSGDALEAIKGGYANGLLHRLQRLVTGKYEIREILGRGGMGAVFLARDIALEREVAIKVLPPEISLDEHVVRRFQQEAKTAARLDHPNIIPIYRVESEGGLNYFVMKYVPGQSLEEILEKQHALPVDYIQRVLWEAACALGHAHQRGVVHRDVKPANIMFDHDGRVMLTDFGISKALQAASGFTGTGMIVGTPHYMAPEQAKGAPVDGRADQYSLGIVAFRMIAGELPFSGDSVHTILYKHIFEEPPPTVTRRPDIPDGVSVAVARALAKTPELRFPTMEEFATAVWPEQPVAAPLTRTSGAASGARARTPSRPRISGQVQDVASAPTAAMAHTRSSGRRPTRQPTRSRAGLLVAFTVVALAAAGVYWAVRGGVVPDTILMAGQPEVVDLKVAPPSITLAIGGTDSLWATAFDRDGQPVAGTPVAWTSNKPDVVSVDSTGVISGLSEGRAVIEARVGTRRDNAAVEVFTPAAPQPATPAFQEPPRPVPGRAAPPPAAPAQGYLSITSEPYATLYIDGATVGETPKIRLGVSPGRHRIRLERAGYRTYNETVQVDAGNEVKVRSTLIPEQQ